MDAPDRDADLVEVLKVYGPAEAEVIRNFLESQGISCLVRGQMARFVYPLTVDGLAEYKILVPASDAPAVRVLLESRPQEPED